MTVIHFSVMFYEHVEMDNLRNFYPQDDLLPEKQKIH